MPARGVLKAQALAVSLSEPAARSQCRAADLAQRQEAHVAEAQMREEEGFEFVELKVCWTLAGCRGVEPRTDSCVDCCSTK